MHTTRLRAMAAIAALSIASTWLGTPPPSRAITPKPLPPTAYTSSASQLTSSSARLQGSLYPSNQQTSYYFQYGTTTAYGLQTPLTAAGAGTSTIHVSAPLGGLAPFTAYHFRLVAVGPGGTAVGLDRSFMTLKIPLTLTAASAPNPVVFGSPVTIEGTLSGTGNAGMNLVLQTNPYPYRAGFHSVGNATLTSASGHFSFSLGGLLRSTRVRVKSLSGPIASSPVISEQVAVRVSAHLKRSRRHGFALIYGSVSPSILGAGVAFERLTPGKRYVVVRGAVAQKGTGTAARYSRVIRVRPGIYRVLVSVVGGRYVSGYSRPFRVRFG